MAGHHNFIVESRMKKLIFILISLSTQTFSQTVISGRVTDTKGEAIPGANVVLEGTYDGASTDVAGRFTFETEEVGERQLSISFVGFKKQVQVVNLAGGKLELTFQLKEDINQLDAVVITAGSFTAGEERRRTVLKATDIATTAGATADIAGALNTLPGTQKVGESGRLFVRGGDGEETRTFIDGMAVMNPYQPSAPNAPSRGRFLPFMFKGTSFSTGGYSAEYGEALSSALVLDSKDKADLNQTDVGILSVGADMAHTQVWDRSSVSGKIQYTNIKPYFNLINQYIDWVEPPTSVEGSMAFRTEVGKDGMFKFFGNLNHSSYTLYQPEIRDPSQRHLFDLTNDYQYGNATYRQPVNDKSLFRGGISFTRTRNDISIDGNPMSEQEEGLHAKTVLERSLSHRIELKFGGELIHRHYTAARWDESSASMQSIEFVEPIVAGFLESDVYLSRRLVTRAGLRPSYNRLSGELNLDPRLSLAVQPFKVGQFSLAYGRFHQSQVNQYLRLDKGLKSQLAEHYILNYQIIQNNRTFRAELYYKRYNHLVKFNNVVPVSPTTEGHGYARGFELFWRDNRSLKNVDYWISYSYLDTERDYLDYPTASTPYFASRHNLSVVYKHFVQEIKSQLGFTYSYASGRPYHNPNVDAFNSGRTPFYQDVSANVAYLAKPWLIIYVSATNLLGRDNIFGYEFSSETDASGSYASRPIRQAANRFLFMGVFITFSKNKSVNQLPNL